MQIAAQIVGIVALICAVTSFQQKTHKYILVFQITSTALFMVHYFLLGAYTGSILNAIALVRSVIFVNKGKKWADNIFWLWFFVGVSVVAGILTWQSALSLLPMAGLLFTTVAFWIKTPKYVRMTAFPSSPLWLIYNLASRSYGGAVTEIINMISIIVAMIRLDFKKK